MYFTRAQSFMTDLRKFTREHGRMKCYGLGLGLDSFRMIALTENFRKLDAAVLLSACQRCARARPPSLRRARPCRGPTPAWPRARGAPRRAERHGAAARPPAVRSHREFPASVDCSAVRCCVPS
jgi:hypothetical protein